MDDDLHVEPGAEDVLAEVPGRTRLLHRVAQPPDHVQDLTPDVDERVAGPDRVRGDGRALDEQVRVGHHQRDVLAGTRFRFVRVDHQEVRLVVALRQEIPLHTGREAGPTAAAQPGVPHDRDDLVTRHAERLRQRLPAARPPVPVDGEDVRLVPVRGQHRGQGVGHRDSFAWSPALWLPAEPGSGAVQPCSLAIFRPTRSAGPAAGPCVAWSSLKPARIRAASRQVTSRSGPRVGVTGFPARRSSASWRAESGVMLSKNSQFTIITGAYTQAALHSTCSRLTWPSGVTSSSPTPRCSRSSASIWLPPRTAHIVLVHTPTWYVPTGWRLYMV